MLPISIFPRALSQTFRRELPKYFNQAELRLILSEELRQKDYSSWFLVFFLSRTGCRITEAINITVASIDFSSRTLRARILKRRDIYERAIPLTGEVIGVIAEYIASIGLQRHDKLFSFTRKTAYIKVQKACRKAGFDDKRCHPHTLRHTFAVNAILNGVPIPVLQSWLGHRDIYNTLVYTQVLATDSRQFAEYLQW
ncbi:Tyrosine recombinase XerD [Sporomusa rhizae]|uniref:tyrosine-type recombinase/integrase n=1 Tax=Sporomusa rhizae TaxID=357999 RepID=UPI00352A2878